MPRAPAFPVRFQSRHSASHHPTPCLHPVAPDPRPIRRLLPLKTSFLFCSKPCCEDIRITHPSLADTTSVSPGADHDLSHRAGHDCLPVSESPGTPRLSHRAGSRSATGWVCVSPPLFCVYSHLISLNIVQVAHADSESTHIHTHTLSHSPLRVSSGSPTPFGDGN